MVYIPEIASKLHSGPFMRVGELASVAVRYHFQHVAGSGIDRSPKFIVLVDNVLLNSNVVCVELSI